jgi:hypothetical protein
MGKDTRSRKHQLTFNNPQEHGFTHDKIREILGTCEGLVYWCMADEVGDEGTPHTCLYLHTENPMRFSTVRNKFPGAHIEQCRGTARENRAYIRKEGEKHAGKAHTSVPDTFEEWGDCPEEQPGKRNDLDSMYARLEEGWSNYQIVKENPRLMRYLSLMEQTRQMNIEEKYKDTWRTLENEYIWGPTRAGKTRSVMERHGYSNVYRVTDYKHPWDSYKQQRVILFDEFRSSLPIEPMNNYLDGYPLELPCRYANKRACWEKVYVVSNIDLLDQYPNILKEYPATFNAFTARFNRVTHMNRVLWTQAMGYRT